MIKMPIEVIGKETRNVSQLTYITCRHSKTQKDLSGDAPLVINAPNHSFESNKYMPKGWFSMVGETEWWQLALLLSLKGLKSASS